MSDIPLLITKQEFIDRFTAEEWSNIQTAKLSNTELNEKLEIILSKEEVYLVSNNVLRTIELLHDANLITTERTNEIIK